MNKVVFQILWTIIRLSLWIVLYILPASSLFWKISQSDENWWGTPFLRNSSKSTSRRIFEKKKWSFVWGEAYYININEINLFKNLFNVFLFYQPAEQNFRFIRTYLGLFITVFFKFSQASVCIDKFPSQLMRNTFYEEKLVECPS